MTSLEDIFRDYSDFIYKYILSLCGNSDIADEITQQTFFKAMNSLKKFKGECDIRTWLCTIAKNTYFTYCKKSNHTVTLDETNEIVSNYIIEEKIIDKENVDKIHNILHNLKEPYKEVFMLRVFGELSFKKIGILFGKSDNWACVTFYRAKQMIQRQMEENDEQN